jgi:hypothetical protein
MLCPEKGRESMYVLRLKGPNVWASGRTAVPLLDRIITQHLRLHLRSTLRSLSHLHNTTFHAVYLCFRNVGEPEFKTHRQRRNLRAFACWNHRIESCSRHGRRRGWLPCSQAVSSLYAQSPNRWNYKDKETDDRGTALFRALFLGTQLGVAHFSRRATKA